MVTNLQTQTNIILDVLHTDGKTL